MIITLILFSSALSVVHYLGLQEYLVIFLSFPLEYYLGFTLALVLGRVVLALYRLVPLYRSFVKSAERVASSSNAIASRLSSLQRNKVQNKQTRGYSTHARPNSKTRSGSSTSQLMKPNPSILELLRSKYRVIDRMIPLTDKIGTTLRKAFGFNNMLSFGRVGRLAPGVMRTKMFVTFLLRHYNHHGVAYTIKWLKASHVAIMKCLGENKLLSLRTLEADLPLPRLKNGLPGIIPYEDRKAIRRGNVKIIRLWLGLFGIYRLLQAPGVLKLNTITDKFSGNIPVLRASLRLAKVLNPFLALPGVREMNISSASIEPKYLIRSLSASPSNRISMFGWLTDWALIRANPLLHDTILKYLRLTNGIDMTQKLAELTHIEAEFAFFDGETLLGEKTCRPIVQHDHQMMKAALRAHGLPAGGGLGQFAIKEEAAGKIRVFALVDSITQSVLKPLHDILFSILRKIPNDGTFDQEKSIQRCMEKATASGKAFSFDLTAATDRLPVLLTQMILGNILGSQELARAWKALMVFRPFCFLDPVAKKLNIETGLKIFYKVGQPMGALSSWAGLAITHHWVVQVAARNAYPELSEHNIWFDDYEILGDDIVIFDERVAREYLILMDGLGCGINMSKSIESRRRPVFEFAKRVCWKYAVVSGISFSQVRSM